MATLRNQFCHFYLQESKRLPKQKAAHLSLLSIQHFLQILLNFSKHYHFYLMITSRSNQWQDALIMCCTILQSFVILILRNPFFISCLLLQMPILQFMTLVISSSRKNHPIFYYAKLATSIYTYFPFFTKPTSIFFYG